MKKISIIIPAFNEEKRIKHTLQSYFDFFLQKQNEQQLKFEFIVVLNGCKDHTLQVVEAFQNQHSNCTIINIKEAGKGLAIKTGFLYALNNQADLIGFVDADMATSPEQLYALYTQIDGNDGIIASRYMKESKIFPSRPWIKRWGSFLVYESLITLLFGLRYKDYQCGAKLFKANTVKSFAPYMTITHWAFDVEILYLCKINELKIKEVPTIWHDQAGSKLRIHSGIRMLGSLFNLRLRHSSLARLWNAR